MLHNLTNLASIFTKIWGIHFPSAFLFGERDFPKKED